MIATIIFMVDSMQLIQKSIALGGSSIMPARRAIGNVVCLIVAAALAPARAQDASRPSAKASTYINPIFAHDFPDPWIITHDGRYYAYATETRGTGFQLLESDDLVHWTPRPLDFPVPWAREHYWAPEVFARDGTFYLTYSALDPESKKHHIGVATATAPTGPFRHRALLVRGDDNEIGVIDATIAHDDDGDYLVYSEERPRRIVMRRLRSDLMAVEGEPRELIRPDLDWEHGVTEAPVIVRRNGLYHLFYSGGPFQGRKDGPSYATGHAVARLLSGPYTKDPQPLLKTVEGRVYGPGHPCVFRIADDSWWIFYHGWDNERQPRYGSNPRGRTLRVDRLEWRGDTPSVAGPSLNERPAPAFK